MSRLAFPCAIALAATLIGAPAQSAGFQHATVPGTEPIEIGIWYPSDTAPPGEANTPFGQALALDAAVAGTDLPLVVLSHGYGAWMGSHADTAKALADTGYIAVAPTHPGTNFRDLSAPPSEWLQARPRQIVAVIDFMLEIWNQADRIDAGRIGVFGMSAGGYTALAAAGGKPDIALAVRHCAADPTEFVCGAGIVDELVASRRYDETNPVPADPRIRAISIAAPVLAFAFDRKALAGVAVPVQIWSGSADETVPYQSNIAPLVDALPATPEVHMVEQAGHFAFLAPCDPILKTAEPRLWAMACVDASGFDRVAFHARMNADITAFFDRVLKD